MLQTKSLHGKNVYKKINSLEVLIVKELEGQTGGGAFKDPAEKIPIVHRPQLYHRSILCQW